MLPGQPLDLDHTDDRAGYLGMSHATCNRRAGGQAGQARRRANRERIIAMVAEVALAMEIAEDRAAQSIVAAGCLPDELVLLEVAAYLTGTDPTAAVLELQGRAHRAGGGRRPTPPRRHLYPAAGGRRDHRHPALVRRDRRGARPVPGHPRRRPDPPPGRARADRRDAAPDAAPDGSAAAAERRGALVDVSPAVAAELAAWALLTGPKIPLPAIY